jgi:hypothetical protein
MPDKDTDHRDVPNRPPWMRKRRHPEVPISDGGLSKIHKIPESSGYDDEDDHPPPIDPVIH